MASTGSSVNDSNFTYALSVRVERPVCDCELQPHPFLSIKGGNMDNIARGRIMDANPHYFTFRWFRGKRSFACAYTECSRAKNYDPNVWTRFSRGGPGLTCAICEKNKIPRKDSFFCSMNCFQNAWKRHSALKHTFATQSKEVLSDSTDDDIPLEISSTNIAEEDRIEWEVIGTEKSYTPTDADVGCDLRVEVYALSVNDDSVIAGPVHVITEPVLASPRPPPKRQLIMIPGALSGGPAPIARFRVVSYNILSELYATKQAYPYCDSWSLNWPYRRKMLLQELDDCQGDIICLQEIQADHFEQQFKPYLYEKGYDGLFKQKSRESMGQQGKVDGCGVFWKRSKFIVTESYNVDFNERVLNMALTMGLDENESRRYINRLSKDNIAQVLLMEVLSVAKVNSQHARGQSRQMICLANTHLYSNHQRPDVKLWQTFALISEIERIIVPRDIPLILCGDFNSEPDSAVYELLTQGAIERPHPELEDKNDAIQILPHIRNIVQSLDLVSVMATGTGAEPMFTNYTTKFKGTLDYIFYSPCRLRVLAFAAIPHEKDLEKDCDGLPSANYPSDHVHLCCDVALMPNSTGSLTKLHEGGPNLVYSDSSRPTPSISTKSGMGRR